MVAFLKSLFVAAAWSKRASDGPSTCLPTSVHSPPQSFSDPSSHEWTTPEQVEAYLEIADDIPHRMDGEATLLSEISPQDTKRILDLGCGDGRLLSLVLNRCPDASTGVGLDFSPPMLSRARARFDSDMRGGRVSIIQHDMDHPLPSTLGTFDCIVSSFAIHHCTHERKRQLYQEIHSLLRPGGVFCNLEHVSSPSERAHRRFVEEMPNEREDPTNKLLDVETQLSWLREIGYEDVDCYWKWREMALLVGRKKKDERTTRGKLE